MPITRGKEFEKLKAKKDLLKDKYLSILAKKVGFNSINEVFENGYGISELEKFSESASIETWGSVIPSDKWKFNCRKICEEVIIELYGSKKQYQSTRAFIERKLKKMGDTLESKTGYRNPSQTPKRRAELKKGSNCKNPFSSTEFKYNNYIRGKEVLPDQKTDYLKYRESVEKITNENRNKVEFTGKCYYTGMSIYKYDGNKKVNRNDYNMATIDHKISILAGFLRNISPEVIGGVNNLCWCSKYFNSFKREKCEDEIRLSGIIERFNNVMEIIDENQKCKDTSQ